MRNPNFVQIKTKDGLTLPGLLYRAGKSKDVAIHLHGNGSASVFYYDDRREEMSRVLNKRGISLLLFNNRGAHYLKKLYYRNKKKTFRRFGMAYEKIKECILDIDGAINFLKKQGYKKFYLIGESTGANKICVYHYYKPKNKVSKYVLLGGGDDVGIYYHQLGRKKFFNSLKEARAKIKKRQGDEIIKDFLPEMIFSYQGFYDIAYPDGDYNYNQDFPEPPCSGRRRIFSLWYTELVCPKRDIEPVPIAVTPFITTLFFVPNIVEKYLRS